MVQANTFQLVAFTGEILHLFFNERFEVLKSISIVAQTITFTNELIPSRLYSDDHSSELK